MARDYNETELLISIAANALEDESTIMVGTGMPMLAGMLAQKTHAPNASLLYEAGGIGPDSRALPVSVGDSRTFDHAFKAAGMHDVMSYGQSGNIDFGFLGGAQIDKYGNLNSTVIGDWERPAVRFPGSGGANDIGSWANETLITMRQDDNRFVDELDFRTTPGHLDGPGSREKSALPPTNGPLKVITQIGVYEFDEETKEMTLSTLNPGFEESDVNENSSFEIHIPDDYDRSPEPSDEELRLLREQIDPQGIVR